jgi:phenylalanyl-tRNA synthetase beta chain
MLVTWNWLKDYIALRVSHDELVARLSMAGLNHEASTTLPDDVVIDLEVTSNRPDCLGHIGVAREIAVLFGGTLKVPDPQPSAVGPAVGGLTKVTIACPELCSCYTARVVQGVKIGPSPAWLVQRLAAIGIPAINNVVDITNYVLMECGQPLHAFDFAKLAGREIIVRAARPGELFEAINHKIYELDPGMCVIADAQRPVALGGVMGGANTEVSETTTDVLIESADFAPLSIRGTARKLALQSPSSYRFERSVDPVGIDWASRRCCELILELAGGRLAAGVIDIGRGIPTRAPIRLRLSQVPRVLGIDVPAGEVRRILAALGCCETAADARIVEVVPPSWRRDLEREIDLVEEVARIHGYEKIPEDVAVPMAPSNRSDDDRLLDRVRQVLLAAGFDESVTASVVSQELSDAFSPWTAAEPLQTSTPMLKGADLVRRSLVPSLLHARRLNESLANPVVELFETARIYLPQDGTLPREQWTLALTSGRDYHFVKGVLEALVAALKGRASLDALPTQQSLFDGAKGCELQLAGQPLGFLGEVSLDALKTFGLRAGTTVAELDLTVLASVAQLVPQYVEQSAFPAIERDLNLIVDEGVRWSALAATVRQSAGPSLEGLCYRETYRDPERDGAGKKRLLFSITLRSAERTLTNEQADQLGQTVVAACRAQHGAVLLGVSGHAAAARGFSGNSARNNVAAC